MCTKGVLSGESRGVSTISSAVEDVFCERLQATPTITRSQESSEQMVPAAKSGRSARSSGWKTSKFFSRTMSSGEILRGLKKLSLGSGPDPPGCPPPKSKSGQLKKRSSCGNDDPADDPRAKSPRSPGSFRPLSKAMSLSEPGSTSRTSSLGIVCKKEDLKAILGTAGGRRFPLSSPRKRRQAAPLRQTKSASFDQPPAAEEPLRKEAVRRTGSEESGSQENNEQQQAERQVDALNARNCSEGRGQEAGRGREAEPRPQGSLSAVKWDECEVVDAVALGGAIESFLKGSMSGSEKKVSFRRHSDRKAKSDG
ncbi:uncharacterized protein LOC129227591 [Uloborus diversus]|uniref:uncharacterized protein LOC129227591 n=1 Tax=Uloborus diversus TaxID=327109 RepID=UPI00240A8084|nr:uncharacterized protein LOC129227591 [Uloborus diversus]